MPCGSNGGTATIGPTYDPANHVGTRTFQMSPSGSISYAYDANNRLTQAGGTAYGYDANGNLISTSTGPVPLQSFTYDPFNHLTQAAGSGGTVGYTYYGDGLKRKRMGPDGTTLYYYDGIRPIYEMDDTGAMTAQLDRDIFGNLLSRLEPGGTRRYIHSDGIGSTTLLTDGTGAAAASMLYDAWGNLRTNSGAGHGKYRFTGAELDSTSGLYHMGARFYDPAIGRWLSEDPVQDDHFDTLTLNFYAYAANNPVLFTDSLGLAPEPPNPTNEERQQIVMAFLESGMSEEEAVRAWRGVLGLMALSDSSLEDPELASSIAPFIRLIARALPVILAKAKEGLRKIVTGYGVGTGDAVVFVEFFHRVRIGVHRPHPRPPHDFWHLQVDVRGSRGERYRTVARIPLWMDWRRLFR